MKCVALSSLWVMIFLVMISCSTEPEPLHYGTDICYVCKMTLMDNKFGGELVTMRGKIYKFDDLNCFMNFYNSRHEPAEDFQHRLVIDYSSPGKLVDATFGFYCKSEDIRSPMNGGIALFETKESMDSFKKDHKGIYLSWGEVVTQYK